jgi:hypothetical protein
MRHQVLVSMVFAFVSATGFADGETIGTQAKSADLKQRKTNGSSNKISPKTKKPSTEKPSAPESLTVSSALEQDTNTSSTPTEHFNATTRGSYAVPAWLYGIQLTATPADAFDNSFTSFDLAYLQEKQRLKSSIAGISSKLEVKTTVLATNVSYGSILKSQNLFLKIDGTLIRGRADYETSIITSGSTTKSTYQSGVDIPDLGAVIAIQAAAGIWLGARTSWARDYIKVEAKSDTGSQKATSQAEHATQVVGLEYRSRPAHFGVEYSIQNKADDMITRWDVPIRLALSERLFLGGSVGHETDKDFSSSTKSSKAYHLIEAGIQSAAHAFVFQYEYDLEKSGSDANMTTVKSKTGTVILNFGPKIGMRFGIATSYLLETKKDIAAPTAKKEGGSLQLRIARAQ